mmetsp:Transcript_30803/g.47959  ORF Transcript_30803/g.47959 Transcript_30803/m.47959 type:complete len:94 (+) Transcript_30803:103-384(+)
MKNGVMVKRDGGRDAGKVGLPVQHIQDILDQQEQKIAYQDILDGNYPEFVDESRLETYLVEEEFQELFGMNAEEFEGLPGWKKDKMKNDLGLY